MPAKVAAGPHTPQPFPMKHYVIQSKFLRPFAEFGDRVAQHRAYLQTWYDKGAVLCSGPKAAKDGGVIVARANSDSEIEQLIDGDPYRRNGLAEYSYVEFSPVKRQAFLEPWIL